jgi:hypothetical protein
VPGNVNSSGFWYGGILKCPQLVDPETGQLVPLSVQSLSANSAKIARVVVHGHGYAVQTFLPSMFLSGTAAAGGIALLNSIGNPGDQGNTAVPVSPLKNVIAMEAVDGSRHPRARRRVPHGRTCHEFAPRGVSAGPASSRSRPLRSLAQNRGSHNVVRPQEQVAHGAAQQIGQPPLRKVIGSVMHDVTPLAEAGQIVQLIVAGIVVEVGGRQHDPRRPHLSCFL